MTVLAVVLNYKLRLPSTVFMSSELLLVLCPTRAYILWVTLQMFVVFQTNFPFLAEFLIPFDHLLLPYSTFNSEFCFMQRFVFSIYLIPRCKETVQPNLNFSPFGTCKLMMFPFTHLKFTFLFLFFSPVKPRGMGKKH